MMMVNAAFIFRSRERDDDHDSFWETDWSAGRTGFGFTPHPIHLFVELIWIIEPTGEQGHYGKFLEYWHRLDGEKKKETREVLQM